MNIKSILNVSFSDLIINKLHADGFQYEIEPDRGMFGHYCLNIGENWEQNLHQKTIWLGIDFKGRVSIDVLVHCQDDTIMQAWSRNNTKNIEILENIEKYVNLFKSKNPESFVKIVQESADYDNPNNDADNEQKPYSDFIAAIPTCQELLG